AISAREKSGDSSSTRTRRQVASVPVEASVPENKSSSSEHVAQLVRQCLREGKRVEIDGLGVFLRDSSGEYQFTADSHPKIFLAHVVEDRPWADRLFEELEQRGYAPWLDRRKLLPGQNWPRAIEEAIDTSDFFIAC